MEGSEEAEIYKVDFNRDYRQEFLDKYSADKILDEPVDDSWVELKHKKALFAYCKSMVDSKYNKYPDPMYTLLIKKMYYDAIKNINKEDYIKEQEELNNMSFLEKELQIVKDNETLEIYLNENNNEK
tara:strand:- start:5049 stop:5429 length:381 start_codon:yes stop_codon:yes gene_type:complete